METAGGEERRKFGGMRGSKKFGRGLSTASARPPSPRCATRITSTLTNLSPGFAVAKPGAPVIHPTCEEKSWKAAQAEMRTDGCDGSPFGEPGHS